MRSLSRRYWCVLICISCAVGAGLPGSRVPSASSTAKAQGLENPDGAGHLPSLRAFPTAEGFGAYSLGGRGPGGPGMAPRVFRVTTLQDMIVNPQNGQLVAAPGSLREAVEAAGPRFVVFRVGGVVLLNQPLFIRNPYLTIAGQTAPNPGITIGGAGLRIRTRDVVLRHLRIRMFIDEEAGEPHGNHGSDSIQMLRNDSEVQDPNRDVVTNVMIDHCSLSWGIDENIDIVSWVKDVTVQWSIIAEAAKYGHREGSGGAGWLVGRSAGSQSPADLARLSIHHNIFAHNLRRNPRMTAGGTIDFRNNVIYNWYETACMFIASMRVNYVGNYLMRGIDTPQSSYRRVINVAAPANPTGTPKLYIRDNIAPQRQSDSQNDWDIGVFFVTPNTGSVCPPGTSSCRIDVFEHTFNGLYSLAAPTYTPAVATDTARVGVQRVLQSAGATLPSRDVVDRELVEELSYVHQSQPFSRTDLGYDPTQDPLLRHVGVHHGETAQVLTFRPTNDPGFLCVPRQYRMRPGMSLFEAKWVFLNSLSCTFPDGITLPQDAIRVLNDPATYPWNTESMVIPDRRTLQTLYPTNTVIPINQRIDSDQDGIPDFYEYILGTDPNRHDSMEDANVDGYLNLENYLNLLAP